MSKFTPKIQETRTTSKSDKLTNKPISFVKLSLLIFAKTSKKVMEISKFFKKGTKLTEKKDTKKLYTQALSPKTSKILKIKETFLKLPANKIDNIHKIIKSDSKSKPKLNIMTKGFSRKQVIILISNNNKAKFMKSFSVYITNLNRYYGSRLKGLSQEATLVLSNTRELDRVPNTK